MLFESGDLALDSEVLELLASTIYMKSTAFTSTMYSPNRLRRTR